MNHSDSERIAGFLESLGLEPIIKNNKADSSTEALAKTDFVIFNTCGVRQMAEDRVYGQIHNIRKQESRNNNQKRKTIILTGCLANRKDVQRRLKNRVDLFCEIKDFPEKIKSILIRHPERNIDISRYVAEGSTKRYAKRYNMADSSTTFNPLCRFHSAQNDVSYLNILPKYKSKYTALVPIMTGCNNFCSYCVVPYTRGREISRPVEDIIKEIKLLIKKGYKEIMLLGQNVNSYRFIGKNSSADEADKNKKNVTFLILLKRINSLPGNFWIWFVSNHPKDFSSELIEAITKCQKVCECVHLPIQAGDDKVLSRMNRKYTAKKYLGLVKKIKKSFSQNKPGTIYSITSDVIVGFPGETKKQFMESAKIMEKVSYDMVYFGQFSPRPETVAYKMKDNVSKEEKARREKYLNEILKKTTYENNKKYVGKIFDVLVTEEKNGIYFGHTRTYKNVKIISKNKKLAGKIIKAKITKANIWNLEAHQTK